MEFLRRFSFGGCLADDMGVGKTAQVLAMLETRRALRESGVAIGPSLVVVPRSLVFNWMQESERFTPLLRVLDYTGALDTRERILAAAVRRIASEGIDGVRIARIAMDAGVSSSLVHYHFDTREELLAEALAWSYEHVGTQRAEIEQDADATHAQRLGGSSTSACRSPPSSTRTGRVDGAVATGGPPSGAAAGGRRAVRADARLVRRRDRRRGRRRRVRAVRPRRGRGPHLVPVRRTRVRHVIGDQTITLQVARDLVTDSLARDLGIEQHQLDTMVSVP